MALPKNPPDEEECEDWMTTFADMVTLLMTFFIMLLNFSKIDIPRFEQAAAGISNKIGMGSEKVSPIQILKMDIVDTVTTMKAEEAVKVDTDDRGVVIELASSAFYRPGSAEINDEAGPVLANLAYSLMDPKYDRYVVEIEGHTDDDPISTSMFPSNWELSSRRATRVVRFFIEQGMEPKRLKAAGFAETRPKVPNRRADGSPIPENQAANRRVILRTYPMSPDEEGLLFREMSVDDMIERRTRPAADAAAPTPPPEE